MQGQPPDRIDVNRGRTARESPRWRTLNWEVRPVVCGGDGRSRQSFLTRLPEAYAYFEGHFPAWPVLAAAVQLHELVLPCLRRSRPDVGPLRGLKDLKFLERIGPGAGLEVALAWEADTSRVDFEIFAHGVRASAGTLVLARAGDREPS